MMPHAGVNHPLFCDLHVSHPPFKNKADLPDKEMVRVDGGRNLFTRPPTEQQCVS